ncbi:MAG: hypothetical protein WD648_07240 [Planctomycetaceae bacterium]
MFTALDQKSKLLAAYRIGKRNHQTTAAMIADLERRMVRLPVSEGEDRPQLSTDGWASYIPTIGRSFGQSVKHGILIKQYRNPESGRYAPPALTGTERIAVQNITDVTTICTSHVERCNGTIRQWCKRFTRLTYAFSKKLENLAAAVAIHVAAYNFVKIHGSLKMTPAMAAGVVDKLWSMDDLYNAVMEQAERKRKSARIDRLIAKLREQN